MPPKAAMRWSDEALSSLLDAFIIHGSISTDAGLLQKAANYVGNGCTVDSIKNLFSNRKAKLKKMESASAGVVPQAGRKRGGASLELPPAKAIKHESTEMDGDELDVEAAKAKRRSTRRKASNGLSFDADEYGGASDNDNEVEDVDFVPHKK